CLLRNALAGARKHSAKWGSYVFSLNGFAAWAWYWLWIAFSVGLGIRIVRHSRSFVAGAAFVYFAYSALRIFAAPVSPYFDEEEIWSTSLALAASSTLAIMLLAGALPKLLRRDHFKLFWHAVA